MTNPTPEDVQTYLNRQQQGEAMQRQFDAMPEAEHDEVGAVRRGLDAEAQRLSEQSASLVTSYKQTTRDVYAIRNDIANGTADPREAAAALSAARKRLEGLNRRSSAITVRIATLEANRADPAGRTADLVEKYPALRR